MLGCVSSAFPFSEREKAPKIIVRFAISFSFFYSAFSVFKRTCSVSRLPLFFSEAALWKYSRRPQKSLAFAEQSLVLSLYFLRIFMFTAFCSLAGLRLRSFPNTRVRAEFLISRKQRKKFRQTGETAFFFEKATSFARTDAHTCFRDFFVDLFLFLSSSSHLLHTGGGHPGNLVLLAWFWNTHRKWDWVELGWGFEFATLWFYCCFLSARVTFFPASCFSSFTFFAEARQRKREREREPKNPLSHVSPGNGSLIPGSLVPFASSVYIYLRLFFSSCAWCGWEFPRERMLPEIRSAAPVK